MGEARSHNTITFAAGHLDLTDLRVHTEKLILAAHKCYTHKLYDRAWDIFNKHLDLYQKELQDIQEVDIIEVAFLSLG